MNTHSIKLVLLIIAVSVVMILGVSFCGMKSARAQEEHAGQTSLEATITVGNIEKESVSFQVIYNVPEVYLKDITELKIGYLPFDSDDENDIKFVILTPDGKTYPDGELRTKKSFVEGLTSKTTYKYIFVVTYKGKLYAAHSTEEDQFTTK
jgi:hypothetical protein